MGQDPQVIRSEIAATRERMGETAGAIAYRTDVKARTRDRIAGNLASARATLGLSASQIASAAPSGEDVREGAHRAAGVAQESAQRAVGVAQENPLGLALGSVALGFVAGLFVPTTRVEAERLGPVAGDLKEQVIHTGQEALEQGRELAQDAFDIAQEAAGAAAAAVQESAHQHVEELKENTGSESTTPSKTPTAGSATK